MPRIAYVERRFSAASLDIIAKAEAICGEYMRQGFDLTLRQLYYQFVARDFLANAQTEYKRLGSIINDARLAGLLDWDYIVDRTRNLRGLSHWDAPESIIRSAAAGYRTERWANQPHRVEVWIEKDALVGVISGVCQRNDVDYFSCRGYTSQSELWGAAQRLARYERSGQKPVVIHLGDHDPSGIDMTRDIAERLRLFGADVDVRRIALNMDQVETHQPPPNPAKLTDSRASSYVRQYGRSSWELDALDPTTLDRIIESEIRAWRDAELWDAATQRMERERRLLKAVSGRWHEVAALVAEGGDR
ncbi:MULTISPECIES: hypothetical protein [Streptomycetaceae]|uniref:DUF2399 domain-containing protein n=1 Tax=Streptantibioticus cattleyicolor (strain ATCC 35852 / DSM 46488 / JCM 4925 / NBRC 14057 / NRRL 8057) TaxID=1003195 RepID=F8JWV5_STREN|nr:MULTISPECIES: hypothetical protein [Streptomycetaceae]AEW92994.1 hypothetical protein SCATT_06230 [Streptantibioticus cattleyicolor NRRL 8057 = DSM 46488]MYS57732.1 hypothetical protein [Streptomyces sp. SID5468]CCB73353.1 conserved protein of unknown function [Streptantibioticus cattleyicolor NRRL 8057 = DSM 46488]